MDRRRPVVSPARKEGSDPSFTVGSDSVAGPLGLSSSRRPRLIADRVTACHRQGREWRERVEWSSPIAEPVNLAMRTKAKIEGVILVHPGFWGSERMGCEKDRLDKPFLEAEMLDRLWPFAWGGAVESDDPRVRMNPMAEGAPSLAGLGCGRALVVVAERDRGRAYYDALRGSGWGGVAELLQTEGEDYVFHLLKPGCDKAVEMMAWLAGFLRVSGGSMRCEKAQKK